MAISIDFSNARAEARKVAGVSEQCGQIKNTVLREKDLIPEFWNGESGATFMELVQAWSNGMASLESDFGQLSQLITRTANEMEEEERQRAERIRAAQIMAQSSVSKAGSSGSDWTDSVKPSGIGNVVDALKNPEQKNISSNKLSDFGRALLSRLNRG